MISLARVGASAIAPPPVLEAGRDGWSAGPPRVLLLGPPGTGKTRAAMTAWLLPALGAGLPPAAVLSCSFTRAAAWELRRRAGEALRLGPAGLRRTCSTIHAEALRLVHDGRCLDVRDDDRRRDGDDEPDVGPEERLTPSEPSTDRRRWSVAVWDVARNRLVLDPGSDAFARVARELAPDVPLGALRAEVAAYEAEKAEARQIDFTDMLVRALERPAPTRELLLVDEAQDSSLLQWALLERWAQASRVVVAIGDPDQTVHAWAGASPGTLLALAERGYAVRRLARSHRVPRRAHALARGLILRNRDRLDAPYEPADAEGALSVLPLAQAVRAVDQAAGEGHRVFVLTRSARSLGRWATALAEAGVLFAHERGPSPLGAPASARRAKLRALLALREGRAAPAADVLTLARALPERCLAWPRATVVAALEAALDAEAPLARADLPALGLRLEALLSGDLRRALGAARLGRYAAPLARLVERHGPEVVDREPTVVLTTMHGAKGREAELVVVDLRAPGLVWRAVGVERGAALEAERRVVYVALTRSLDRLLLVRDGRRDLGELVGLPPVAAGGGAEQGDLAWEARQRALASGDVGPVGRTYGGGA